MKRNFKKLAFLGLVLTLVGGLMFVISFAAAGFNFSKLSGIRLVEKTDSFDTKKLIIEVEETDVRFEFSEIATEISVKYHEKQNRKNQLLDSMVIKKTADAVTIKQKINYKVYVNLWDYQDTKMTVVIPESKKIELIASTDTGDITLVGNASFTSARLETDTGDISTERAVISSDTRLEFEVDTGDIELGKFNTATLSIESDTGSISLNDGYASNKIEIEADTGDVEFDGTINTPSIMIETDTGDVEAERNAVINAEVTTVKASTGDVSLIMSGKQTDYGIIINTSTGESNIQNQLGGPKTLNVRTSTGDVRIYFAEK